MKNSFGERKRLPTWAVKDKQSQRIRPDVMIITREHNVAQLVEYTRLVESS